MFRLTARWLLFGPLFAATISGLAADQPAELPAHAKQVERILVPVPKEIFHLLDEFHNANWRAVQRLEILKWKSHGDQVQIALLLGTVVAEGFIAMETEDSTEVRKVGNRALSLARGLGVEETALRRSKSIMEYADAGKWPAARKEWDNVLSGLEKGLIALKSEPLSHLVSLSGWLRGTDGLCVLVLQDYSAERAELIRQPAIVDYLQKQLLNMKPDMRNQPIVVKMDKGLRDIRAVIEPDGGPLTAEKVKQIGVICEDLVKVSSQRSQ